MHAKKLQTLLLVIICALFFLLFSKTVKAQENFCEQEPCFVPAPTILTPLNHATSTDARPAITGLTWKTTKVSVFVDGVKLENLKQVKHEDFYASFYARPENDLTVGEHTIYAIAESEKEDWGGKSKSSYYTYYTVTIKPNSKPIIKEKDNQIVYENKEVIDSIATTTKAVQSEDLNERLLNEAPPQKPADTPAVNSSIVDKSLVEVIDQSKQANVNVNEQQINGSVSVTSTINQQLSGGMQEVSEEKVINSDNNFLQPAANSDEVKEELKSQTNMTVNDYQQRLRTNRLVGFIILAGIALVSLIWLLLKEPIVLKKENDESEDMKDDSDINSSRGL